jgi:hypothetical protein
LHQNLLTSSTSEWCFELIIPISDFFPSTWISSLLAGPLSATSLLSSVCEKKFVNRQWNTLEQYRDFIPYTSILEKYLLSHNKVIRYCTLSSALALILGTWKLSTQITSVCKAEIVVKQ